MSQEVLYIPSQSVCRVRVGVYSPHSLILLFCGTFVHMCAPNVIHSYTFLQTIQSPIYIKTFNHLIKYKPAVYDLLT